MRVIEAAAEVQAERKQSSPPKRVIPLLPLSTRGRRRAAAIDLLLISLFSAYARSGNGSLRKSDIWAGQYLGFGALIAASALIGRGLALAPEGWLWLLALVPLGIGVVALANALRARSREEESHPPPPRSALGVAMITIIDGADDLAAYTPFFATAGGSGSG
jgi:cadmium resistance protein CadD (predicted permease)